MAEQTVTFKDLKAGDKIHYKDKEDPEMERKGTILYAKPVQFEGKDSIQIGIKSPSGSSVSGLTCPVDEPITIISD